MTTFTFQKLLPKIVQQVEILYNYMVYYLFYDVTLCYVILHYIELY